MEDNLVFNQKNKKGDNNGLVINQLSEKLIAQYDNNAKLYKENAALKDKIILDLEKRLKANEK